jgi:hypothetical protein
MMAVLLPLLVSVCPRGMLPTEMSGMFWLRSQIKQVMDSVWLAATAPTPAADDDKATVTVETTTISTSSSSSSDSPSSYHGCFKPDLILANQLAYGQVRWGACMRNFPVF